MLLSKECRIKKMKRTRKIKTRRRRTTPTNTKTSTIYFRLQRKSRILMFNINENFRNRRRKRLFDCKQCKRIHILTLKKHKKSQLPPMLSIFLPLIFLLTLTTSITTTNTRTITSVNAQPTQNQASGSSNDDEELSKTMNGIGDEELNLNLHPTTTSSSTIQPQLSSNNHINNEQSHENESQQRQQQQQQQHQERNEHSIKSIWTPTDGNHDDSLASSADLMRQPKVDEEFAGHAEPSELNRQFISVVNNQSDIVFNNNTKHEPGNELQHATTFLLGKSSTTAASTTSASKSSQTSNSQNNNANNNIGIVNGNNDDSNCNNSNSSIENRNSSNENSLSGGRFNDGLFTSPSSIRMIQFESQSNVTTGNNRLASPAQIEQTSSSGNSMLEANNFVMKANTATKQRAHYGLKPGKKRKKARLVSTKAGYTKQNKSNKGLNNSNGNGNNYSYNSNYLNSTNVSSGEVGSKMISYSLVPTATAFTTTTSRPKLASFSVLNKQDLENQMMLAATSSPIRSIVMPNKQNQLYQQISPPATTSSVSNRNIALIFPNGAIGTNFGDTSGGSSGGIGSSSSSSTGSSGGNQIKLPTISSPPPDGRDLATAAAAAAAFADQFGSSSSLMVSPPVINNNRANSNNNNKESFIFDSSNNVLQKQSTTSGSGSLNGKNMPDSTVTSGSNSLSHLFPSSVSSSYASPSASTISTTAASTAPTSTSKSSSYPLSVIDPATRASLFEQLRRSPQNNKGGSHTKQSLSLNEFLITSSSSHQPNEFETTLKQQPEHQHEPIVQAQEGSNAAIEANSSEVSPSSQQLQQQQPNASSSLDDLGGDDEGGPDNDSMDPFEMTHGGDFELKSEPINGQDQDGKPTRLDIKTQQQQQQQQQQQLANEQNLHKQQQKPVNTDTELLVGPFKSESEAPATITLSGVVYQKSGASSSFIRQTSGKPEQNDKDNLSTSGSQQAASSSATTNNNRIVQLKPNSGNKILDSSQLKGLKIEDLLNQADKNWPHSANGQITLQGASTSSGTNQPQLGSINEILLGSIKPANGETMSLDSIKDSSSSVGSSSFQLPDSYTGLSGGIRLGPFPWSPASLLSNSFFGSGSSQFLDDLTAQKVTKGGIDQQASTLSADHAPVWGSSSSSLPSLVSGATVAGKLNGGSGSNKLAESYYLGGSMNTAASDSHYHSKQKDKGPIVIVQKDVKPVKYHLMRAYLKLRRLLRPFEATYVFLNDRNSFVKRKQIARQMALKGSRKSSTVSSLDTESVEILKTLESPSKT